MRERAVRWSISRLGCLLTRTEQVHLQDSRYLPQTNGPTRPTYYACWLLGRLHLQRGTQTGSCGVADGFILASLVYGLLRVYVCCMQGKQEECVCDVIADVEEKSNGN